MHKSRFLDAEMDLVFSHDEGSDSIYIVNLKFMDPFGRQRSHYVTISLPSSLKLEERVSFTAMSSINLRLGIVICVSDLVIEIMTLNGSKMAIANAHEHDFKMGDRIGVIEHVDESGQIMLVGIPYPFSFDQESLYIQSVNADLLDASGKLVVRFCADPLHKRLSYVARVAT